MSDQSITYRVNLDDTNFQAKLTQMRASIDSTVGGMGGMGGFGRTMAYVGPMGGGNFSGGGQLSGGLADFGAQVAPVTYTPPAIAMQPHFGMFQIQQTLGQAGLASFLGPSGIAINGMRANGMFSQKDYLSPQISYQEYMGYSTRSFADRVGATATSAASTAMNLGASSIGGLLGGMAGGFMGGMLGATVAPIAVDMAAERAADNISLQTALASGSFRAYQGANVDPLTGRGFNRQDRVNIATGLMRMESNDARFNTTDYRQIMETGMQMDLFSGTRDAEDFQKKFKGLVETVKTVSSTLHTTLREGLETIRGLRDMGVTDPMMQQSMVMKSEVMGRMAGKTGMEMMAVGQAGAEMFRGTGIAMERGFSLNQQNTAMVQQMLNQGAISRETVAQMGGINAAGQQLTAGALSSFQTTLGRGTLMAAFNPATGALDPNMIGRMAAGDTMSMMGGAAALASSPGGMAKFIAHQEEMISKMSPAQMQAFDIAQTMQMAKTLQSNFGGDINDWFMTAGKQYRGKSKEELDVQMGMLTMDPSKYRAQLANQTVNMASQQNMEAARNNYLGSKFITNAFTRLATQPLSEAFVGIQNRVARKVENIAQDVSYAVYGDAVDPRQLNNSVAAGADKFLEFEYKDRLRRAKEARGGADLSPQEAEAEAKRAAEEVVKGGGGSVVDLSETGVVDWFGTVGGGTQGTATGNMLREIQTNMTKEGTSSYGGKSIKTFGSKEAVELEAAKTGQKLNILGQVTDSRGNKRFAAISDEQMGTVASARRNMQVSEEEVNEQIKKIEKNRDYIEGLGPLTVTKLGRAVVGKDFSVKKWQAGEYTKTDYARMLAAAEVAGDKDMVALIKRQSGTEDLGSVGNRSQAEVSHRLGALRSDIRSGLKDTLLSEGWDIASSVIDDDAKQAGILNAINAIQKDPKGGAARRFLTSKEAGGAGLSSDEASRLIGELKLAKQENPTEFANMAKRAAESLNLAYQTKTAGVALAGSELGAAGGVTGDVSAKTAEAMVNMMKTFEEQLKIVQALQENFKASLKNNK